ncbi:HAMP domain-containing sensor histidine kinase [Lachnospiraceae bacterium 42-17]
MFTQTDYDKLKQIMEESPDKKALLTKLLETHRLELSSLSHEIRNPLTLVYSTLQLIESSHPEVLGFKHWDTMRRDIEYMNHLLEELSSYNKSGQLSLETICTESFLKSLVLSFAASLTDTDIEFTSRLDPKLPNICADSIKLKQVILNLLKNAQDAALVPYSSYKPCISFHACVEKNQLYIIVKDNGCGICSEHIDTIFEPFITYKKNGTGLGLPIARRIACAHGGSLTVSSEPGSFTEFILTLPI